MLRIIYKDPRTLIPYPNNARTHTDAEIDELIEIIKELGFNDPIALDDQDGIIEGHRRQRAAIKMGLPEVPTINLSHLSDRQKRAYILAHNRVAENAGWDLEKLTEELNALATADFDLSILGWDEEEVDKMLKNTSFLPEGQPDDAPVGEGNEPEGKRGKAKAKILHICPNCKHEFTA